MPLARLTSDSWQCTTLPKMDKFSNQTKALVALAFTVLAWGVTTVFVRAFSIAAGPFDALLIRLCAAGLLFFVVMAFTCGFSVERRDWPRLLFISLVGTLGYFAFSIYGFVHAPAGIGTLIMSTQPMIISCLAWFAGSEKLTIRTTVGLLVSLAGSALLLLGDDIATSTSSAAQVAFGCLLIFFAGVAWALFVVYSKPLIQKYGALKITGLSSLIIVPPVLPFIGASTINTLLTLNTDAIFSLVFLTFIAATLSVVTWNYAAGIVRPSLLGSALYVVPVLAVLAGWVMLDEPVTANTLIAASIILIGVAISQMQKDAKSKPNPLPAESTR
jgi:drug/metabolite transporter (DMT)-like permease